MTSAHRKLVSDIRAALEAAKDVQNKVDLALVLVRETLNSPHIKLMRPLDIDRLRGAEKLLVDLLGHPSRGQPKEGS